MHAFVNFDKPIVVAVQGAAIGGGTSPMLTHCDFIYAGESAKFQMPFINLAVVTEFGIELLGAGADRSSSVPRSCFCLGSPFDAKRAAELGLVTEVVSDKDPPGKSNRNGPEAGEPSRSAALQGQQEAHEAAISRADQGGDEGRERRVQCASPPPTTPKKRSRPSWKSGILTSRDQSNLRRPHDHGKADECVRAGWRACGRRRSTDVGECADVARAILDEARTVRDRAITVFQSGSGNRLVARAMDRIPPARQGRRCSSVRHSRI